MNDDPGWNLSWKSIPLALVPQLAIKRSRGCALETTRQLFVSFSIAMAGITVVVLLIGPRTEPDEPRTALSASVVLSVGVVSLLVGRIIKRRLDCRSASSLADAYVQRFFLRLAVADTSALAGFVLAISVGAWPVYFIGLAFTIVGFVRLAPSRRNLAADQRELTGNGCQRSLLDALLSEPARTASSA